MPYSVGDTVTPVTLSRVEGGDHTVDPSAAAATVVVFTANHCPYALAWHERIQQLARDYADQDVHVVQINPNDEQIQPLDSTEASAARVAAGDFAGPYLRDSEQEVARTWGAQKTPDVFIVDRAGTLVYRGAPDANYEDENQNARFLREALDDILASRTVSLPSTEPVGCSVKWSPVGVTVGS